MPTPPARSFLLPAVACIAVLLLPAPSTMAALHITEFMADNSGTLRDSDGDSSDWLEIFNSGPADVDLANYYLTDEEDNLTKWRFPATPLAAGEFLLVFASEKDRRAPGEELHTNFRIEQAGEFLALVSPNGSTIVAAFGPADDPLPAQFEDVSYGLMQTGNRTPRQLITAGASGRTFIPEDNSLGNTWTTISFDDSAWIATGTGIGYDEASTYVPEFGAGGNLGDALNGVNTSVYLRLPFNVDEPSSIAELTLRMKYDDGFVCYLNGVRVASENAPPAGSLSYNSEATANHSDSQAVVFSEYDLITRANLLQTGANVLAIHGLNDGLGSSDLLITPEFHAVRITDPSIGGPGYLGTPTPGTYNGDTFGGFVADTKFSVDRGFFDRPFQLTITTATEDAEIRYTLDGTPPSPSRGQVYTRPVSISSTTIVRAMAHKPEFQPTNIDTHTYLFPADVVSQPRMRTSVTQSGTYGPQMAASLRAVPSISIVTQNNGFLNESGGNIREEYHSSVEMIFPDGTPGFQEDGGLSNYGGRFTNFRKKSFRMAFRTRFGAPKLRYPIFDGFQYKHHPPTDEFDAINLRSGSHDMASRGAYMSNRFTDDTMLDMGNIAPHGRFVHLYLNGNYWGQYHLRERWNADMASSYFGGPEDDYEAVNANDNFQNDEEVYDGVGDFWAETKALIAGSDPFNNASDHIDVANIVDFMLLWVSGNSESEFRAFGSESREIPFKFMIKDADGFLRMPSSSKAGHAGPRSVMSRMTTGAGGPDFEMLVADRIHKHFFNDGAFTPDANIARLQKRVNEARLGFISESARWGDVFREFTSWESYQNNLVQNHFPGLTGTMIGRFKSEGMYPDIIAPVFSQHGGSVLPTTPVTMATDADTIYYTLDGSDPRLPGGVTNPTALVAGFNDGVDPPVTFISTGHSWRYLDDGSNQGLAWRAAGFDDSSWSSGPSRLGYGNDGEGSGTLLSFGPDSQNKFPTTYFRTTIEIPDPSAFLHFLLRLQYDDAAAVYLNGTQVLRTGNLPAGAAYDQYASSTTSSEGAWLDEELPTTAFVAGTNTIAVEIHQASGTSSDIRMDMILRGETSRGGGDNISSPITFTDPTLLRARAFNTGTGEWSALNEAFFTIDTVPASPENLVLSEFHYHPANPATPAEAAVSQDRDDYEFLEFLNVGPKAIDLTGVRFDAGVNFSFPDHTVLPAGDRLLLVRNRAAFEARYGSSGTTQVFDYTGRISNDGELLRIVRVEGGALIEFTYNDQVPWPIEADGGGASLVLIDPQSLPDHHDPANWMASRTVGGSPGASDAPMIVYEDWAATFSLAGGPDEDDDLDGISNYWEYLHGTRPDLPTDLPGLQARVEQLEVDGESGSYLVITFRENLLAEGSLTPEISDNLVSWSSDQSLLELISRIDNGDDTVTVTIRLAQPIGPGHLTRFIRLRRE